MSEDLRMQIAGIVERYQWDSAKAEAEALELADAILSLPEIANALEIERWWRARQNALGPSVSTNKRTQV